MASQSGAVPSGGQVPPVPLARATPGQPRTIKGERTRERILDAALALFARSGFTAVSLRSIAAAAGLSHAGVLRYFADKDTLLLAVLERRDEVDLALVLDHGDVVKDPVLQGDGPRRFFDVFFDIIERNSQMPGIMELYLKVATEATEADHPAHAYFIRRYDRLIEVLRQVFDVALRGTPGETLGPVLAAEQFVAIVDGSQLQWLLRPDRVRLVAQARAYLVLLGVLGPTG